MSNTFTLSDFRKSVKLPRFNRSTECPVCGETITVFSLIALKGGRFEIKKGDVIGNLYTSYSYLDCHYEMMARTWISYMSN